jgi:hypothetical protein
MCGVMISSLFQCGSKNACGREMGTKMKLKSFHLVLYIREPIKIAGYMRECATCALAMYPSNKDLKADMAQLPRTDMVLVVLRMLTKTTKLVGRWDENEAQSFP